MGATSNNTNLVTGIPNQLAPDAGATPGKDGEGLLVVYQGGTGPAPEESATPDMGDTTTEAAGDVDKFTDGNNQPDQQAEEQADDSGDSDVDISAASSLWLTSVFSLVAITAAAVGVVVVL